MFEHFEKCHGGSGVFGGIVGALLNCQAEVIGRELAQLLGVERARYRIHFHKCWVQGRVANHFWRVGKIQILEIVYECMTHHNLSVNPIGDLSLDLAERPSLFF